MDAVTLILSDASGIYIPQRFVEECLDPSMGRVIGVSDWAREQCAAGPDSEHYWDAWDEILREFQYWRSGACYTLHQDGDLWLLCTGQMTDEELQAFEFDIGFDV
jgi:hypothetical protein